MIYNFANGGFYLIRQKYKFLEFFAGVGLAKLGLGHNWECIWANDISSKKAEIYRMNHEASHFVLGDVADVSNIPINADMAWASFPCQDLSLAGWRSGMLARRSGAFWPFWNHMFCLLQLGNRPPLIVIENVVGLIHSGDFEGLCESLLSLGMQFGTLVIDASHFVPQSRQRVFLVAVDLTVPVDNFTINGAANSIWFPEALLKAKSKLPAHLQAVWRWWNVPVPENNYIPNITEIIEREPTGVSWNSDEETQRLLSMMTDRNRNKVEAARLAGGVQVGFLYKRIRQGVQRAEVRFDGIAGCLRTPRGGSSRQTVVVVENGVIRTRLLSPREAARLMGVEDTFWLPDAYNHAYEAMGDGLVVPVVSWLSRQLLEPLQSACNALGSLARGGSQMIERQDVIASYRSTQRLVERWRTG